MISCSTWGLRTLKAVAGAGGVEIVPPVVVGQPVVGGVVDAAERQRRPELVALGGVVVDDVEDDLETGLVQGADHRLELRHLLAELPGGGVLVVRGEEADRVVAPVVAQAALGQVAVVDELVHRQQLDGGDAEVQQVLDHRRVSEARVGAALVLGYVRMQLRQPADVGLVDDALVVAGYAAGGRCPSRSTGWPRRTAAWTVPSQPG
jgi:hypothetical protein